MDYGVEQKLDYAYLFCDQFPFVNMANSNKKGSGCALAGAGCGTFLIIVLLLFGVVGYFGYKFFKSSYNGIKELAEIATIENDVVNQTAYVPPADGLMSLEQVESLVYIQTQVKEAIGPEFESLTSEHQNLLAELEEMNDFAKIRKLLSVSGKLVKPLSNAKRAQIDAINREGISMSEYKWLRSQAMAVLGIPDKKLDLRELLETATGEPSEEPQEEPSSDLVVNPQNRQLLEPHALVLGETLMLSAIGL